MRNLTLLLSVFFLFSCGSNQFAKRKYTKGVYVEKRSHGGSQKHAKSKKNPKASISKVEVEEHAVNSQVHPIEETILLNESPSENEAHVSIGQDEYIVAKNNQDETAIYPPKINDGEVLRKTDPRKRKKLETNMMVWSIISIASAVIALVVSFVLYFFYAFSVYGILIGVGVYMTIPTGITGAVLASRFKKHYEKQKGNIFFILALVGMAIALLGAVAFFVLAL